MSDATTSTRMPPKGTWKLDPNHTVIGAVARHLMVTKVRGRFTSFEGAVHIGDMPEDPWAELQIDAASIDTGVEQRDHHLRSGDFLDVVHHPKITLPEHDGRCERGEQAARDGGPHHQAGSSTLVSAVDRRSAAS